jgi:hypothetical protein
MMKKTLLAAALFTGLPLLQKLSKKSWQAILPIGST